MHPAIIVSYPRSGQHYTEGLLKDVTGADDYCVPAQCDHGARRPKPGCPGIGTPLDKRYPCPLGRRFQKSHDPLGNLAMNDEFLYSALYRRPLYSFCSHARMRQQKTRGFPFIADDGSLSFLERKQGNWERFALQSAAIWRDFVCKWVAAAAALENVYCETYERITTSPEAAHAVFGFLFDEYNGHNLDRAMARQISHLETRPSARDKLDQFEFELPALLLDRIRETIGLGVLRMAGYDDIL